MANPAQSFQDDEENWGPSSHSNIAESATPDLRLIKTVRVVVHDNRKIPIPDLNPLGLNHWTIFLVIEENKAAVRMDMRAGSSNSKGDLGWKKLHYSIPNSKAKSWDWKVMGTDGVRGKGEGVCPEGVYELLLKHGFDRYRMHESGQGCRHWMWVLSWSVYLNLDVSVQLWYSFFFLGFPTPFFKIISFFTEPSPNPISDGVIALSSTQSNG